ncbi:ATP-dependent DNA helicase RecQ-like [Crassostrea angulata]|uniref:ATP-dependent DNA helicase RecQ-like n=1 Tax=Magallana angulata TaxID=2784310 RepID=UPI0022B0CFF5|nr:ATP-dependent DNA helicase RecQ-like [Crassostrea angulata]
MLNKASCNDKASLKNDCISVLPTGYGKSLIFEILPFVDFSFYDRQCLVLLICPLNVIIEQEIAKLGAKSIRASDLLYKDESKDLTPILYIVGHPEDITQPSILEEVSRLNRRTFIVVDEAHLVPQWGEEFRPMFRNICNLKSINSHLTFILALTATASVKVQKSIASHLTMKKPVFLRSLPVLNSNIKMTIQERPSSTGGNNRVHSAYDYIFKPVNSQIIEDLKSNKEVKVVLATVALGMGADLRNVKHVIHAGPPTSPEVYVQEVGRAGRDGQAAEAKLYFNNSDLAEKPIDNSMIEFIRSKSCRRQHLSAYFDAPFESVDNCCDVCCKEGANVIGFKVPSLEQRHYVRLSLQAYINADPSGELGFIMSEEKVQIIVDCFEFIKDESYLSKLLNSSVPESVSSSLFAILSSFQND